MPKLIDRYLTREILGPFGVALLTFVVLITGHILFTVVQVIVEHGVPLPNIAKFLALQIPRAVVLALPVSTLLGCSLGLNRLASERELTALRTAGISLPRIMRPALLLGLVAVVAAFLINEYAVPWANGEAKRMLHQIVLSQRTLVFRPGKFTEASPDIHFFVEQVDRGQNLLKGVYFFVNQQGDFPVLFQARQARFTPRVLQATDARFYHLDKKGNLTWATMASADVNVGSLLSGAAPQFSSTETMRFGELIEKWQQREQQQAGHGRRFAVEIHWRIALAFSCLVFALLAGAMTQYFSTSQQLAGVLITLLVVFVYYVLMLWLRMLGNAGSLPPVISGWLLNGTIVAASLLTIWRQR